MNLKEILAHKLKIIEIAAKVGFTDLRIHNVQTEWMEKDNNGNLPLAFVATKGSLLNNAECRSRLGLFLGCKVDIVTEDSTKVRTRYIKNSVSLMAKNLEEDLVKLFDVPLANIEFSPLQGIERDIAKGHIKEKDNNPLIFQETKLAPFAIKQAETIERIEATAQRKLLASPPKNG